MVNFPIEGLDLEDRVSERRIARSLDLADEECREYGIEPINESLLYDLCKRYISLRSGLITDFGRRRR